MKKTLAGFFGVLSLIAVFLIPSVSHAGWIGTPSTVTVTADPPSVTSGGSTVSHAGWIGTPSTVTVTADPPSVTSGGSTVISWAVSEIKPAQSPHNPSLGCTKSGAWSGFIADTDGGYSGSYNTGSLTSNKTYSISCLVPGGDGTYNTITNSVTVGVDAALPPPEPTAEDGNCGYYDKQVSSSHPSTGMWDPRYADYGYSAVCDNGSYSNSYTGHTDTGDYWNWRCNGSNGGAPVFCSAYKSTTMFDLSVYTVSGVGTSTASGINCGTDCTQSYSPNTTVTLRGTSAAGYQTVDKGLGDFFGVSCASGGWIYDCTFIMTGDKTVGVRFRPITYTLTTSVTGGVGTITGIGINCSSSGGSACSETINSGTTVTLTATGGSGYIFGSWSGTSPCAGQGSVCSFLMNGNKTVNVSFTPAPDLTAGAPSPTVATAGTALTFSTTITNGGTASTGASFNNLFQVATAAGGGGTVSAISVNSRATLTAGTNGPVTSSSYTFPSAGTYSVRTCADNNASFIGAITESNEGNNCGAWTDVTVAAANAVPTVTSPTATSITTTGATLGANVTSLGIPAAISARGTCWATTPAPTTNCTAQGGLTTGVFTHARTSMPSVTLIYYRGYATNTTGTGYSADATFTTTNQYTLTTLITTGNSTGSITGTGISCGVAGSDCSENYTSGTPVTLTATGGSGYAFSSWSGACSGNLTTSCTVTMDAAKSASASFTVVTPFDYSLSNSGALSVTKGSSNVFTQNTITKTLVAGATESVTITATGMPTGVSVGYDANRTSNPTGNSTITFTITPTATVGTHSITVTGSPLNRTTSFNLTISGSPITVTCTANPSPVLIGQSVTWTASVSGGVSPLTYVWSGTNLSPAPTTNPFTKVYTTIGQKTATVTVTDSDGTEGTCVPAGSVQVNFDPTFEEF